MKHPTVHNLQRSRRPHHTMASITQQYGIPGIMLFLTLTVLLTGCTKKSDECYEMLGKQGEVAPLLSELESDDAEVRANALTGVGFAAQYARQDWALERNRDPVDPAKLIPAVKPVIRALRDEDNFVRYCAGHALRYLAESVEDPQALARITNALVEHKPSHGSGNDYKHFIEGLSAIAANIAATCESRARARQILDAESAEQDDLPNTAKPAAFGHSDAVLDVAFGPDGQQLVSASRDRTVKVWDLSRIKFQDDQAGEHEQLPVKVSTRPATHTLTGHTRDVTAVDFSADGQWIASGSDDGTVIIWNARSGEKQRTLFAEGMVSHVEFGPESKRVLADSYPVRIWDITSGESLTEIYQKLSAFRSVALGPRGERVAIGSSTVQGPPVHGRIKIWKVASEKELLTLDGRHEKLAGLAFGPKGKRVASGGRDKTVKIWDAQTGEHLVTCAGHTGRIMDLAFSADGKQIASCSPRDPKIRVWNVETGRQQFSLTSGGEGQFTSVTFSRDGNRVAAGSFSSSIYVWQIKGPDEP